MEEKEDVKKGPFLRYKTGPNKGRFMKQKRCSKCDTLKKNESQGKIYTPADFAWTGHRIVDMQALADGLWCKICEETLSLRHCIDEKRTGFTSVLRIKCIKCGTVRVVNTAPEEKQVKGLTPDESQHKIVTRNTKTEEEEEALRVTRRGVVYGLNTIHPEQLDHDPLALSDTEDTEQNADTADSFQDEKDDDDAAWIPAKTKPKKKLNKPPPTKSRRTKASNSHKDHDYVIELSDLDNSDSDFIMEDCNELPTVVEPETTLWELEETKFVEIPNPSGEVFACEYCDEKFNTKRRSIQHMREEHTEYNELICAWCQRKCISESAFRSHRRNHRGEAGCMCETCGKRCRNVKHLELHALDHLPDELARKFACSVCGKRYKTESYVLKHERLHTADKAFMCDQCPKKFLTKKRLLEHMQLHTGDFKYTCELCPAKFTRKDNMTQHIKQNHRFVCPLCNCTFTTADEVKLHRNKSHTREEVAESEAEGHAPYYKYTDFQCDICHRFLASKQSLNFHIATHTGEGRKRPGAPKKDKKSKVTNTNFQYVEPIPEPDIHINENVNQFDNFQNKNLFPTDETLLATSNLIRDSIDTQ